MLTDASVIKTPLRPKGKVSHKVREDSKEEEEQVVEKVYAPSVD